VALAIGQHTPQGIAVDATNVYFTTSDGNVVKIPIDGGATTVLASGQGSPMDIAVRWHTGLLDEQDRVGPGHVGADQRWRTGDPGDGPGVAGPDIAVANGVAYWTNSGAGMVMKLPLTGGTPWRWARRKRATGGLASDADALYWASGVSGTSKRCARRSSRTGLRSRTSPA